LPFSSIAAAAAAAEDAPQRQEELSELIAGQRCHGGSAEEEATSGMNLWIAKIAPLPSKDGNVLNKHLSQKASAVRGVESLTI
jgi:hypothetical protein